MVQIGRMRHRLEIYETPETVDDGMGGEETQNQQISSFDDRVNVDSGVMEAQVCIDLYLYEPVITVWANVEVDQGMRDERERQLEFTNKYKIIMRSAAYELTTKNVLIWNGLQLSIHSIQPDMKDNFLTVIAWG